MNKQVIKAKTAQHPPSLPLARYVCIAGIVAGLFLHMQIWYYYADGLSVATKTSPFWDFNNLWSGTKMAISGHVDWLFDVDQYRAELRRTISPNIPNHEWSYPPSMLLIGVPFAILPEAIAYLLWTFCTIGLFYLAVRTLELPKLTTLAITFSPAIFFNSILGQNGALTAAFLIAGLSLAPKRPIIAGICFGLLTIKPQFGLLIPFILLASRNWQAIISAGITAISLALATGLFFGFDVWTMFFANTQPLMRGIMEAPYMQAYHISAATIFVAMRSAGLELWSAYFVQAVFTTMSLLYSVWIWRKDITMDHRLRVAITAILVFLATPYGYTYDLPPVAAAIGIFFVLCPKMKLAPLLGLIWLSPLFNSTIVFQTGINYYAFVLIFLLGLMYWNLRGGQISQGNVKLG